MDPKRAWKSEVHEFDGDLKKKGCVKPVRRSSYFWREHFTDFFEVEICEFQMVNYSVHFASSK